MSHSALAEKHPWTLPWWKAEGENTWVLIYLCAVHILAILGLILFPLPGWKVFFAALAFAGLGGLGTTVGYHRALAHRAVKLHPMVAISLCFGYFLFGWAGLFWVGAIRMVYCLHGQCFVNSLLHLKPGLPEGVDSSQNIWWLGPLQVTAWGENWHGNHHAYPASACFSRHWWQVDIGWYVIRSLEAVGLATNVRR